MDKLTKEEIDYLDFASIFKLVGFENENDSGSSVEIKDTRVDHGEGQEQTTIILIFDENISSTRMKVSLNTDQEKLTIFEKEPKVRKDEKYTFILQNEKEINLLESQKTEERVEPAGVTFAAAESLAVDDSIMGGLILVDPTGTTIKASQMMKVLNKFIFLDIEYGKEMKPFLEQCAKIEKIARQKEDQIDSKKFTQKFSRYEIGLRLKGDVLINTVIYLFSWIFKIIELVMLSTWKDKTKMPSKIVKIILKISRKLKFVLFCSYSPKIIFFGTRVLFHSKTSSNHLAQKLVVMIALLLVTLDFYLVFNNMKMILKFGIDTKKPENEDDKDNKMNESQLNLNQVLPIRSLDDCGSDEEEEEKVPEIKLVKPRGNDPNRTNRAIPGERISLSKFKIDLSKGFSKKFRMNNKNFFSKNKVKFKNYFLEKIHGIQS